jgi:hypothetical protein
MKIQSIKISDLRLNTGQIKDVPKNPRFIKGERFEKLKKSIQDFPEMLEYREIVVYDNQGEYVIIGGNMRFRACKELGYKELPCKIFPVETEAKRLREFVIKDNIAFGLNDSDILANEWEMEELIDWGMEEFELGGISDLEKYTKKITAPIYTPNEEKPNLDDLFNNDLYLKFLEDIDKKDISIEEKEFLRLCASRHIVFDYRKIADYYAYSNKEMQDIMENLALIIIDYKKAIEFGYLKLSEDIIGMYDEEYGEN